MFAQWTANNMDWNPATTLATGTGGMSNYSATLPAGATGTGQTFNYSVSGLPAGLSFNASTRAISGSLAHVTAVTNLTFSGTASSVQNGRSVTRTFTIPVNPATYTISGGGTGWMWESNNEARTHGSAHTITVSGTEGYTLSTVTASGSGATVSGTGDPRTVTIASLTANVTLSATVVESTYTITYNSNGGTGTIQSQTKRHFTPLTLSDGTAFSRSLHRIIGWNASQFAANSGDIQYALGATLHDNANMILYAVWEISRDRFYTLHFIDGATNPGGTGILFEAQYNQAVVLPDHAWLELHGYGLARRNAGFTLIGWSNDPMCNMPGWTGPIFTQLDGRYGGSLHLYAVWR
jgi:hypothetical protein